MNGQWIGKYSGSTNGTLVVDLDDRRTHWEGYAHAFDDNPNLPSTYAKIDTGSKGNSVQFKAGLSALNPISGFASDWSEISKMFPGIDHGKSADVTIVYDGQSLKIEWTTDIGTHGKAVLLKSRAGELSDYIPISEVRNWSEFKEFVNNLEPRKYIFRGQAESKRLRTSFHRTGRADLLEFLNKDIKTLHRHLSQRTKHIFRLDSPDENGAFFNLVQHHGYPTPLLDWSYSPFVSAFFAYRNIRKTEIQNAGKVRIFIFDQKEWCKRYPQMNGLVGRPHFSIMEFIAIENERLIPQQSISSVTNIDDIETYIKGCESSECKFLQIIDLPMVERPIVMRELAMMGITAGSLFPGIDGACEELKARFFSEG